MDFGFLHCVDDDKDFDKLLEIGVLDYIKTLMDQSIVRHIGCSSYAPKVSNRILDTGLMDMMMFSINPAYDFEKGGEYGIDSVEADACLGCRHCESRCPFSVKQEAHTRQIHRYFDP